MGGVLHDFARVGDLAGQRHRDPPRTPRNPGKSILLTGSCEDRCLAASLCCVGVSADCGCRS